MGSIAQALQDKDFLNAHPDDQRAYLSHIDPDFAAASPQDQSAYLKSVLAPHVKAINAQPTQFEKERPQAPENYGFTAGNMFPKFLSGVGDVARFGKGLIGDISNPNKPLLFGSAEEGPQESTFHKYAIRPGEEQMELAKRGDQTPIESIGHTVAGAIPLIGPWVAGQAEKAGKTQDIGGTLAETGGQVAGGELLHGAAKVIPRLDVKPGAIGEGLGKAVQERSIGPAIEGVKEGTNVVPSPTGQKILNAAGNPGGIGATPEQLITKAVRPRARAHGWEEAVNSPGVQRAIQEYNAQTPIKDLRDFDDAVPQIKEKIWNEQIQPAVERQAHLPIDMRPVAENIRRAITPEMREFDPGSAKSLEDFADKFSQARDVQGVNDLLKYVNAQLNTYFGKYPSMRYADRMKNPEIAGWESARQAVRDQLLGTMEKAGESQIRDARQDYGHLSAIEKELERKTNVADRRSLLPLYRGLGLLGAWPTHGLSIAAGELMTHLNSPESLLQRGIGRLNPPEAAPFTPPKPFEPQYPFSIGPQKAQYAEPAGPQPAPPPFEISGANQPNRSGLWDKDQSFRQIGQLPGAGFGEPYTPRERFEPIEGEQQPLNLPGPQHELFNLPQTPRVPELQRIAGKQDVGNPVGLEQEKGIGAIPRIGGPGRQGVIGKISEGPRTAAPETQGLAPGQSTYDKFYDKTTDRWAPEREKMHDQIAADAIKGKTFPKDRPPEAIITVGGTAAGKTTLTRAILGEDSNRVNVDSDANKLNIPEYKGLQKSNPKKAAALVHDESKAISKRVIQEATKNGLDFIYDTSTGGGGEGLFKKLKDLGYSVRLVYADIPTEEAVSRANKRAKESTDPINRGRFVPDDIVRKKHVEAARAFRTFMDSPYVDEIRAFDTTEREPKEFFRRDASGEKILDQKILDRAKEKANERLPAAK